MHLEVLKKEAGKEMLPLVRNVPNVFMACYQIDCFLKNLLFICFCLCWVSVAVCKRSRNGEWGLPPVALLLALVACCGAWASVAVCRLSGRGAWAPELVGSVQWHAGLVALWHEGSSRLGPQPVPCIGGWISSTTRESLCEMILTECLEGKVDGLL